MCVCVCVSDSEDQRGRGKKCPNVLPADKDISLPRGSTLPLWQGYRRILRPDAIQPYTFPPAALMLHEDRNRVVLAATIFLTWAQLVYTLWLVLDSYNCYNKFLQPWCLRRTESDLFRVLEARSLQLVSEAKVKVCMKSGLHSFWGESIIFKSPSAPSSHGLLCVYSQIFLRLSHVGTGDCIYRPPGWCPHLKFFNYICKDPFTK